jgi:hypothetical protein
MKNERTAVAKVARWAEKNERFLVAALLGMIRGGGGDGGGNLTWGTSARSLVPGTKQKNEKTRIPGECGATL